MKQLFVICGLCLLMLQSCSYSSMMYIVNYSSAPVTIQYQIISIPPDKYYLFSNEPYTGTFDKTKSNLTLIPSPVLNTSFNKETQIVTALLQPNQALELGDCRYFNKSDTACRNTITANVKWLKIIHNTDTLLCPQRMIPDLFNVNDDRQVIYSVY